MRNQEWIAVSKKLPEKGGDYLVTNGYACMVSAFRINTQKWDFWQIWWWSSNDVTHWMPLPERPKN